jgi:hypothetical protein
MCVAYNKAEGGKEGGEGRIPTLLSLLTFLFSAALMFLR